MRQRKPLRGSSPFLVVRPLGFHSGSGAEVFLVTFLTLPQQQCLSCRPWACGGCFCTVLGDLPGRARA